jgi:two-component system nitrate/nitrite response regulator NarL
MPITAPRTPATSAYGLGKTFHNGVDAESFPNDGPYDIDRRSGTSNAPVEIREHPLNTRTAWVTTEARRTRCGSSGPSTTSMNTHRGPILVVDADRDSRRQVSTLVERAGFTPREAATAEEGLAAALRERPALVLDLRLPSMTGYELCHELREEFGETLPIVFLSADRTEPADQVAGLLVGASDYVIKPFLSDLLLARLRRLVELSSAGTPRAGSLLTPREQQVLSLLAAGRSQAQVAQELVISPKTAAKHIERILNKLGVHSRAQAVAVAHREGLAAEPERP